MRKALAFILFLMLCGTLFLWLGNSPGDSREQAEQEHGIKLPASASEIQCRGDAAWMRMIGDHGMATMFEMSTADIVGFEKQFHIETRSAPIAAAGDPAINGFNVWPKDSRTFVPGNQQYGGFAKTWKSPVTPVEMLSCASPTGDWLHVEIWKIDEAKSLVKLFTSWN